MTMHVDLSSMSPDEVPPIDHEHLQRRGRRRRFATRLGVGVGALAVGVLVGFGIVQVTQPALPIIAPADEADAAIATAQDSPFNPGGALHCSGIQLMTPSQAKAELESRGYDVSWNYFTVAGGGASLEAPPDSAVVTDVLLNEHEATIVAEKFESGFSPHERIADGVTLCDEPPLPGRSDLDRP